MPYVRNYQGKLIDLAVGWISSRLVSPVWHPPPAEERRRKLNGW